MLYPDEIRQISEQKINLWILFFLSFFLCRKIYSKPTHLQILKSKYPYGLLGNDFGILSLEDLAINTCKIRPILFDSSKKFTDYPYWQCFETKKSKLFCDGHMYFEDVGGIATLLVIKAEKENAYDEYLTRKVISARNCKDYLKDWKYLTRNEKYVCISGSYNEKTKNSEGKIVSYWIFDKFKTKRGCVPYFKGDCSLKYQIKNGCHLDRFKKE